MLSDIHATRARILSGQTDAPAELERAIAAAQSPACAHAFIQTTFDEARKAAGNTVLAQRPLAGLAVSVKDLFDVAGQVTAAGSTVLADAPVARKTALRWPGCGPRARRSSAGPT
jgi:aspartyl-tRNA(Asn)/glutamyl-tRNA(Gln) amidotransferase subunit A